MTDPFANDSTLQNALNSLTGGGSADPSLYNGKSGSITAGTYQSITVGDGTLTMGAGTYYVNGAVTIGGSGDSTVTGTGVTIIASGALVLDGGSKMNVTAPTAGATSGIPGVLFASKGTATSYLNNGTTLPSGGLFYYPNGEIVLAGGEPAAGGCNSFVGLYFNISGSSTLASACGTAQGLQQVGSTPTSQTSVELVE